VAKYHDTNWKKFMAGDKQKIPSAFPVKAKDLVTMRVYFSEIDLQQAFCSGAP
jgi:hypothetical protein